jgi:hypothetical protein
VPDLPALLIDIVDEVAMERERGEGHVIDHGPRDARLDHSHERQAGRDAREIEVIDARRD